MINLEQATRLREKFYDGTSTLSEEQLLFEFLRSENCPSSWQADRKVMEALVSVPEAKIPAGLEERISVRLSRQMPENRYVSWKKWAVVGIAATLTALSFGVYFRDGNRVTVYVDTCGTPQQAACETQEMLFCVSEMLNMGMGVADNLGGACP